MDKVTWNAAFETQGHRARLTEDGRPDFFAYSERYCNGPQCIYCGEDFCEHCTKPEYIPPCWKNPPHKGFPLHQEAQAAASLFKEACLKGDLSSALDALMQTKAPLPVIKELL